MNAFLVKVPQRPGRCRWCGCTELEPCAGGCGWENRDQTLCSECRPIDDALRSAKGRTLLARLTQADPDVDLDDFREAYAK